MFAALTDLVGAGDVVLDPEVRASYETDWTRRFHGHCDAVVRPRDTGTVAAILAWCDAHDVAVVVQGGNTGLVGGSVPPERHHRPVLLLSTRHLDVIESLDDASGQITVGAGVTLDRLVTELDGSGWEPGIDLGARESATIGGMAATNAGGTRVVRHGMMRRNVVGIEVVLANGSVVSDLRGLEKDNTGYDLTGLLVGSEGTLGVITRVRLRLVPSRPERVAVLVGCRDWDDAVALAGRLRRLDGVEALEAVDRRTADLVATVFGPGSSVIEFADVAVLLLVEWVGEGDPPAALSEVVDGHPHLVAVDGPSRDGLWTVRDRATECIARRGVPHKMDVTVPLDRIGAFVDDVQRSCRARSEEVFVFGHLGDGNLHVNVLGPPADDTTVDDAVLELVASLGGSISAEHGIGRLKRHHLGLVRSDTELSVFRALKDALDPHHVLNPGVLLADRAPEPSATT